jgi:uncharacterized protein YcbK (DUF882 family)
MLKVYAVMQIARLFLFKEINGGRNLSFILSFLLILIHMATPAIAQSERSLSFYNTHTGERLTVIYKRHNKYIPESLERINTILRDHRSGDIHPIDPKLMDYLYDLQTKVGNHNDVHIISGYRSPETNRKLRRNSKGVAQGSLHMQGKALDFRLPGTDTAGLRDAAKKMKRGGVGYYKKSDFIQIDTGRVRYW